MEGYRRLSVEMNRTSVFLLMVACVLIFDGVRGESRREMLSSLGIVQGSFDQFYCTSLDGPQCGLFRESLRDTSFLGSGKLLCSKLTFLVVKAIEQLLEEMEDDHKSMGSNLVENIISSLQASMTPSTQDESTEESSDLDTL